MLNKEKTKIQQIIPKETLEIKYQPFISYYTNNL